MKQNKFGRKNIFQILLHNVVMCSTKGRNQKNVGAPKDKHIEVTADDIRKQWIKQDGRCFWSGLPLESANNYWKWHPGAASIDRLDDDQGYTPENIVLVYRMFNLGRCGFEAKDFREFLSHFKTQWLTDTDAVSMTLPLPPARSDDLFA